MTVALVLLGWFAGWLLAGRSSRLPGAGMDVGAVSISVVVPARDEERRLPGLLAALAADPPDEVVVVDDGSTDGTRALALAAGVRVAQVEPPEGWTGKSWACRQGADAATCEVVVFLDADTEPAPGFVRRLAADVARRGGLVSVQPWHRVERPYEHLSATCAVVAVLGAGTGRRPVGFGPAMAMRRSDYLRIGGHALAGTAVAEDLALAAGVHGAGLPVTAHLDDGGGIRARMYPEGLGQLVEGWSKNLAAGASHIPWWRSLLVGLWVTGAILAAVSGPAAYVLFALQHLVLLRRVGGFGVLTALLWPLPLAAFLLLFARSAVLRVFGRQVPWRGRSVQA